MRESVILDPTECDPDKDIFPPKAHLIQLGTKSSTDDAALNEGTAFVYNPHGTCVGTIDSQVLAKLHAQYHNTRMKYPELHLQLGATTFEGDVAIPAAREGRHPC